MSKHSIPKDPLEKELELEEQFAKKIDGKTFRALLSHVFNYPLLLISGLILIFIATISSLYEPFLFGKAIDEALIKKDIHSLYWFVFLFLIIEFVRVTSTILHSYLFSKLGQNVMQDLRIRLYTHLQCLPVRLFDKTPVGKLITRVTNDISSVADMFSSGFATITANASVVLGILIWLYVLDFKLALIATSTFPFLFGFSAFFSTRLKKAYREARTKLSAINAFLAENILGMKIVHLFNRQKIHLERFSRINERYTQAQIETVKVFAYLQPSITFFTGISMALLVYFGGRLAYSGALQIGVLVAFFTYVLSLFQPIREIADKWNIFLSGMASAERIFSVFNMTREMEDIKDEAPVPYSLNGKIEFKNVFFSYEDSPHPTQWILNDFSLTLTPGMKVGIVGHTGAGKTTLIQLLLRFYEPQKGQILIDGQDILTLDKRRLRASIGMIQQDVFLFSGSLLDNVSLWRKHVDAETDPVFDVIPKNRILDERGSNLSMGQRQLIAFSRAKAAKPSVWILDEATANMDSETEDSLNQSLQEATQGKTTLLIAHRLSTVRDADLILVLNKGNLVEQGSHLDLVNQGGLYSKLYHYQNIVEKNQKLAQPTSQ